MSNKTGQITLTSAGNNKSFTGLGFQPTSLRFTTGPHSGSNSVFSLSIGAVDSAGNQWAVTHYNDFVGQHASNQSTSDCIYLRRHNGTTWVDELKANFSGFTADGFELDVSQQNSNYTVFFEASN